MRLVKVKRKQEEKTSPDGMLKLVYTLLTVSEMTVQPETEECETEIYQIWNVTEVWNLDGEKE